MTFREVVLSIDGLEMSDTLTYGIHARIAMAIAASGFNPKAGSFVKKLFPSLQSSGGKMTQDDIEKRRQEGLKMLEKLNNGRRLKNTGRSGRRPGGEGPG